MKTVFRITAILNLSLVVIALSFTFISAITKNVEFLAVGVAFVLASIFPTTLMLVLCRDFEEADK